MQNNDTTYVIVSDEKFTKCIVVHSESNLVRLTNWLARVPCLSKLDSPQTSFGKSQIIVPRVSSDHFKLKILDNEYLLSYSKHTYFEHLIKNKELLAGNWEKCFYKNILCDSSRTFLYCNARYLYSGLLDLFRLSLWPSAKQPCPQTPSIQRWNCSNYTLRRNDNDNKALLEPIYMVQSIGTVVVWMGRVLTVALLSAPCVAYSGPCCPALLSAA